MLFCQWVIVSIVSPEYGNQTEVMWQITTCPFIQLYKFEPTVERVFF